MNALLLYLYGALFWLLIGGALIAWHWTTGDLRFRIPLGGINWSLGWLAVFFACYSLIQWWMNRSYLSRRRALEEDRTRRQRPLERKQPMPDADSTLDFSEPAKPNSERPEDANR